MLNVKLLLEKESVWRKAFNGSTTTWFRGYVNRSSVDAIIAEASQQTRYSLRSWLRSLDGHFAIVVQSPGFFFAASDRIASCPLLWSRTEEGIVVSDSGPAIEKQLELGPACVDLEAAAAFSLSGYTIADRTIYQNVKLVGPGAFIWAEEELTDVEIYATWQPGEKLESDDYGPVGLRKLHERMLEKLIISLDGRPVIIPLSAGLDSRFIASGLKQYGHKNVLCVSYGIPSNPDAEVACAVAKELGYDWLFIPYTNREFRQAYRSDDYARFVGFADTLSNVHFVGEYLMIAKLRELNLANEQTIFINGQSGDFITGNHIPEILLGGDRDKSERLQTIINAIIDKHYKLWSSPKVEPHLQQIIGLLKDEVEKMGGLPDEPEKDYGLYERMEFVNRQSKYVIGSVRSYEYFGHEWRLPLWDIEYLDYWENAPLSAKAHQSLYRDTLVETDWGGVWRSIGVNPLAIAPKWIIPLRFIFKALFFILGRSAWHQFERRFLDYFMTTTCGYAPWPYFKVVTDDRRPFNAMAFYIEHYLQEKNISWDGRPELPHAQDTAHAP